MNLYTASKQLRELDEYIRRHYPKAKGRTVIERTKWVIADLDNRLRQCRATITELQPPTPPPGPPPKRDP